MSRFSALVLLMTALTAGLPAQAAEEEPAPVYEIVGDEIHSGDNGDWIPQGWSGEFSLGGAGVALSRPSFKFGEYTGIEGAGGYAVANGEFRYFKQDRTFDLYLDNLGLDNRKVALDYGKMGQYKVFGQWDQTPHLLFSENRTPYQGTGGSRLTLPASFTRQPSFEGIPLPASNPVALKVDSRNEAEVGLQREIGRNRFDVSFNRIEKNGIRSLGGTIGNSPGNGMGIVLPAPIDFHTNEVRAAFSHTRDNAHLQIHYFGSFFDNRQDSLVFDVPYTGLLPFIDNMNPVALGPIPAQGRLSLEPDNQFHQMRLTGAWDPSTDTRLTATAEYGMALQNNTLFPLAVGTGRALLPRQTAEAEIHNLLLQLRATTSITPRLKITGKLRRFQTDNRTPRQLFQPIVNDTGTQRPISSDQSVFTFPVEYSKNQGDLDLSYQLLDATVLKLDYRLLHTNRDFRAIDNSFENRVSLGATSNELEWVSVTANLSFARTDTDGYNFENVRALRNTAQFLGSPAGPLLASPADFRKKDLAENNRYQTALNLSFFPTETLTLGLSHHWVLQDFTEQALGLKEVTTHSATIDINHTAGDAATHYLFFTYDVNQVSQTGRAHNFLAPGSINDPNRNYALLLDDDSYTAGAGGNWLLFDERVNVRADYSLSKNVSDFIFNAGSDPFVANPAGLPTVKTLRHRVDGSTEYNVSDAMAVGAQVVYENYAFDDFALDTHPAGTVIPASNFPVTNGELITLSNPIQDYEAWTGMLYVTYRFRDR
ncbi:MAG: MtrB/PioB family decaheme-associated outer membrane protein [Nitrospina sp.]|nr:MtrB/PioB family decaheme-associated outer membrane protein [Nitrospina sp.]